VKPRDSDAGAIGQAVKRRARVSPTAAVRVKWQTMFFDPSLSGADRTAARLSRVPGIRRVPSARLDQFILPRFLSADQCKALVAMIEAQHRPSTITDDNGDAAFRTSSTCDMDNHDPVVAQVNALLGALTGIPLSFGEPLQGQRYAVGQEFKAHTDYFEPGGIDFDEHTTIPGQRTWTAMVYLNDVAAGGGTRFLSTGKIHQPQTGKLLVWSNLTASGEVNPATLHHGMRVRRGHKYIITKWYREREWGWV
jgi:prolyl 4-hydroxylase